LDAGRLVDSSVTHRTDLRQYERVARLKLGVAVNVEIRKKRSTEVLVHLVVATVFKTVGSHDKRDFGGFDSHALPPFRFYRLEGVLGEAMWESEFNSVCLWKRKRIGGWSF
jgi:hypothetical protein